MQGSSINTRVGASKLLLALFSFLMIMACSKKEEQMPDAASVKIAQSSLEFKCVYERDSLPVLS